MNGEVLLIMKVKAHWFLPPAAETVKKIFTPGSC